MRGRKTQFSVVLTAVQRAELERLQRATTLPAGLVRRARVLLLLADGETLGNAARIAGLTIRNARKWALRYLERGIEGLQDQQGRGRKPVFSPRSRALSGQNRLRATG